MAFLTWRDRSPHRSDFASVNGVRLHYLDWGGNGPPLLLLAGLFGAAHGILPTIQGGGEIAISSITQTASHLQLNVGAIGASYEGDLKDGQVTGTWSQGPASLPLVFNRTQK